MAPYGEPGTRAALNRLGHRDGSLGTRVRSGTQGSGRTTDEDAHMSFRDLYRASGLGAETDPVDVASHGPPELDADSVVYRLAFTAGWVGEMPEDLIIDGVCIRQAQGPLMTQRTEMRQVPAPELAWDKHMTQQVEVGAGQWLTVAEISSTPPADVTAAMNEWRSKALGALGAVAAILDERIALEEVSEDVLFIAAGEAIAAADLRSHVRPFRPYRITDVETEALLNLNLGSGLSPSVSGAARWYLRGARQGPTPDGFVFFWVALESLSESRSTSPKEIEAELLQLGWRLDSLPVSIGRLAGLRADIVHSGVEDHDLLYEGFFVLETVTRALLRNRLAAYSTWPAQVGANNFDPPWRQHIDQSWMMPRVRWHKGALPPLEVDPRWPLLTWGHEAMLILDDNVAPTVLVAGVDEGDPWQTRAIVWVQSAARSMALSDDPIRVEISGALPAEIGVNEERIAIDESLLRHADPAKELRLAWLVHGAVCQHHLMKRGLPSDGKLGSLLLELAGEWTRYHEFVASDEVPLTEDHLTVADPQGDDFFALGQHIGAATAGSVRSAEALRRWRHTRAPSDELLEMVDGLVLAFTPCRTPDQLLQLMEHVMEGLRE